jgi:hypothetical protein
MYTQLLSSPFPLSCQPSPQRPPWSEQRTLCPAQRLVLWPPLPPKGQHMANIVSRKTSRTN